ncbi:MAG: hypothetical protein QM760_13240 [Nibricoccus sp.]
MRGERNPELLAALGLAELYAGNNERARKFLEAAAVGKTTRARAMLELGRLRLQSARQLAAAEKRGITKDEFLHAIAPLSTGLKLQPAMPEFYDELALAWMESPEAPTQQQFTDLVRGPMIFPKKLGIVYRVAEVSITYNHVKESRILIEYGMANAPDEATRAHFARLADRLAQQGAGVPAVKG